MQLNPRIIQTLLQRPEPFRLPGIDNDEAGDLVQLKMTQPFKGIEVAELLGEKITQYFFLGAGKDQFGIGIEFFGGHHGGQRVKIRIKMCCYNLHISDYTLLQP